MDRKRTVKFIDLFAGIGGTRLGFENALSQSGLTGNCVFTSEIKLHAIKAYQRNFGKEKIFGDINEVENSDIPDFDFLLAGFPCQPFSSAGNRHGFLDERGGLFFRICEILQSKTPEGFLLENVDGLVSHDNGQTLSIIISKLRSIGYSVDYKVLNSIDFGVPQNRKRVYIIGSLRSPVCFEDFTPNNRKAEEFIDYNAPCESTEFSKLLLSNFSAEQLQGKSIKDKRGGLNNIHSWEIGLKGKVNDRQCELLGEILKKRRYKKWAINKGIDWMDGMPLTMDEIRSFWSVENLEDDLSYLTKCGYLKYEHPKRLVNVAGLKKRVYKEDSEKGYNIVAGKLSFPISKILHPNEYVPTIVATEVGKLAIATNLGIRKITVEEGLRFSGFPNGFSLDSVGYNAAFDLLGNTVMPPVIKYVSDCMLNLKDNVDAGDYSISKVS